MKKIVELPLLEPIFSTYHTGIHSAALAPNPSGRNFFLNQATILTCSTKFLNSDSPPSVNIAGITFKENPYLLKRHLEMYYIREHINAVIRNMIDDGYYVYFWGIDDYYVEGKSLYKKKHFYHDGAICGYNQENKTFCMYAYDENWIYQKFWTSQKGFEAGRRALFKKGLYGGVCGIKPTTEIAKFWPELALDNIEKYLDSNFEKYPEECDEARGIVVQEYLAKYIEKLYDGSMPYEKIDKRFLRLIWEHKKLMYERLTLIEKEYKINNDTSERYKTIVSEANTIRMLYASHNLKRRDSVLPVIKAKLINITQKEKVLLTEILIKCGRKVN